jgi:hypothetical protein
MLCGPFLWDFHCICDDSDVSLENESKQTSDGDGGKRNQQEFDREAKPGGSDHQDMQ